jgi:hypothetical protein
MEIKDSIKISKSKLTLTLIDLGYNRRVLYDQVSIINDRCTYLRKIKYFREAGYDIVYLDETLVNRKITAQIICGFRMMSLMPQKYPRVKANV